MAARKTTRKQTMLVAGALALTVLASACGNGEKAAQSEAPKTNTEQAAQTDTKTNQGNEAASEYKTMEDEFGEVKVPLHPQRIVGLYLEDYLTMLGVDPAVQWYHPSWGKQDYLALDAPEFDATSTPEAWLELAPDLILADGAYDAEKYATLSKVAPVYRLHEENLLDPEAILKEIADVLGIPEKATEAIETYSKTMEETKEKLQSAVGDETVAVVRLNVGEKTLALFGITNRYIGNIYHQMGLTPHPWARDMEDYHEVLSEESIGDLDADHIILFVSNGAWDDPANQESVTSLESNPIWQSLPAVKNGNVYVMDRAHWQSGGMKANLMKAEDLLKVMAP